ncbi:hypothetical protein V490_02525 [Pseudogymnoascus sp. VKM F-3557]|nr:hypothetical protein V490_02525 [Pseudogymnoascus sp. VKM F-3557]
MFRYYVVLLVAAFATAATATATKPPPVTVTVTVACAPTPTVDLGYGRYAATDTGYPSYKFSNIRYAAPPVGDLRFRPPVALQGSDSTVHDGNTGASCMQGDPAWYLSVAAGVVLPAFIKGENVSSIAGKAAGSQGSGSSGTPSLSDIPKQDPTWSEDCLFLDVLVPQAIYDSPRRTEKKGKGGAPVLVWIYGGGFTSGDKSGHAETLLAGAKDNGEDGFIYVAFNYRLGMFGWLGGSAVEKDGSANVGLYDQKLALEWVQQNIHLFGGDAERVTVMGESAGASSIMHHITAYGGKKGNAPFQRAILQSPGWLPSKAKAVNENIFKQTLAIASTVTKKTITTLNGLRSLTSSELYLVNAAVVGLSPHGSFTYGPTVDGTYVPDLPGKLLLDGKFDKSVEVMTAHNANEGILFATPFAKSDKDVGAYLKAAVPSITDEALEVILYSVYPETFDGSFEYTDQFERVAFLVGEAFFSCNTRYLDAAFGEKTYSYLFDAVNKGFHGEDLTYTFYNGPSAEADMGTVNATVAEALQSYITHFVATGNPNGGVAPYFPQYGSNSSVQVVAPDDFGTQITDPEDNERLFAEPTRSGDSKAQSPKLKLRSLVLVMAMSYFAKDDISCCYTIMPAKSFLRGGIWAVSAVAFVSGAILNVGSDKDYQTIGSAISAAVEGDTIFVNPGVYREQVIIEKNNITLKGSTFPSESPFENSVELIHALYASDGVGGQGSATLSVLGDYFTMYNMNVTNDAGQDAQAIALYTGGNNQGFYSSSLLGWQDTALVNKGTQFFGRCYIEGAVDFIYGLSANAWFQGITIGTVRAGPITAQGRDSDSPEGFYVFENAKVILGPNAASGTSGNSNLGRPWRDYARVVFQNSDFTNVISDVGWQAWTAEQNTTNVLFAEYNNINPAWSSSRVDFAKKLEAPVEISTILDSTSWVDDKYLDIAPL